jgi:hypothetical protein
MVWNCYVAAQMVASEVGICSTDPVTAYLVIINVTSNCLCGWTVLRMMLHLRGNSAEYNELICRVLFTVTSFWNALLVFTLREHPHAMEVTATATVPLKQHLVKLLVHHPLHRSKNPISDHVGALVTLLETIVSQCANTALQALVSCSTTSVDRWISQ